MAGFKEYILEFRLADGTMHSIPFRVPLGEDGEDGGYYTPVTREVSDRDVEITFVPSKPGMPVIAPFIIKGGEPGIDGTVSFDELTEAQRESLKGDPFRYEDFTAEQLAALKGEPGYTPQKGIDYVDGKNGADGGHYTPTVTQPSETTMQIGFTPSKENMPAVQPVKITLPVNPDYGGNVAYDEAQNLTEEQKAQARENIGAQPAGNYLTKVPEGYAKTEDIPSLDGYAKTEDVPTDAEIIQLIKDNAPEPSGGGIAVTGATVGQTVKIASVDENGVPTAWLPTDFPSGGNGGAKMALLNVVEVTDADVLRIDVTETAEGVPLADLGITKFVTHVAAAYETKPDYTNYMTMINGKDIHNNKSIAEALDNQQRRAYHEFIGGGTVWYAYSENNGLASTGTVGFLGGVNSSNWVPTTNFGEKLDSFSIYLYNGSFKAGTKIMLWGC